MCMCSSVFIRYTWLRRHSTWVDQRTTFRTCSSPTPCFEAGSLLFLPLSCVPKTYWILLSPSPVLQGLQMFAVSSGFVCMFHGFQFRLSGLQSEGSYPLSPVPPLLPIPPPFYKEGDRGNSELTARSSGERQLPRARGDHGVGVQSQSSQAGFSRGYGRVALQEEREETQQSPQGQ